MTLSDRIQKSAAAWAVDGFFRGVSGLGQLHPRARPARHGLEVLRDLAYRDTGATEHLLDVYRPVTRNEGETLPALLYVHGGGFSLLSKDTHWVMGIALARARFVVFSINYRLAPKHRYPAAVEDVCDGYRWVVENAHRYGADASRLVLAGESAGANLVTALAIAACFERREPHARQVFESGVVPRAVMPACGILQVSDPGRFLRRKPHLPRIVAERIEDVTRGYLGRGTHDAGAPHLELADPLLFLERDELSARALPPFFVPCGTADPILDDSRRLATALKRRNVVVDDRYYEGEPHAFHAFVFRDRAKQCWSDTYRFLDAHVPR